MGIKKSRIDIHHPIIPPAFTTTKALSPIWDDAAKYGIHKGHALGLFLRCNTDHEVVQPKPIIEGMNMKGKVRRMVFNAAVSLFDSIRNQS